MALVKHEVANISGIINIPVASQSHVASLSRRNEAVRRYNNLTYTLLMAFSLGLLVYVILGRPMLPAKYSYDAGVIQRIAQQTMWVDDNSYQHVGDLYRIIGGANHPTIVATVNYLLYISFVFVAIRQSLRGRLTSATIALACISMVLGAIYLGTYSKDIVVILIAGTALLLPERRWSPLLLALTMLAYASLFRQYWYLVSIVFLICVYSPAVRGRLWAIILHILAFLLLLAVLFPTIEGVDLSHYRSSVNRNRYDSPDAQTLIASFLPGIGYIPGFLNTVAIWVTLIIPAPLLATASPFHLASFMILSSIFVVTTYAIVRSRGFGLFESTRFKMCIVLILSFTAVQAIFEPDYGSATRHLVPLLPLILYIQCKGFSHLDSIEPFPPIPKRVRQNDTKWEAIHDPHQS